MSEVAAPDRDRRNFTIGDIVAVYRFDGTWSAGVVRELIKEQAWHYKSGLVRLHLFLEDKLHATPCSLSGSNEYLAYLGTPPPNTRASWLTELYPELRAVLGAHDLDALHAELTTQR